MLRAYGVEGSETGTRAAPRFFIWVRVWRKDWRSEGSSSVGKYSCGVGD